MSDYERHKLVAHGSPDLDEQQRQAEIDAAWAQYEAQQQAAADNGFTR